MHLIRLHVSRGLPTKFKAGEEGRFKKVWGSLVQRIKESFIRIKEYVEYNAYYIFKCYLNLY